jgi:exodeoxyribonuclease V alpha subunit
VSTPATPYSVQNQSLPSVALTGVVERITFHSEETGYTVARLQAPRCHELITILGDFAGIQAGQTLQLHGTWAEHLQYGQQFKIIRYSETKPATLTRIEKYLGSGLIKGVGPVTAKRIVAYFALETLEIIEQHSDRLIEVLGIGKMRVRMIQKVWIEQQAIKEVMLFLQGHGVSTTYAVKIFKQYGEKAIEVVTHNPYQLAEDIFGIGFLTADMIARQLGILSDSPFRYRAGISHVLTEAAENGHCFLPQPELVDLAIAKLTTAEYPATSEAVLELLDEMGRQQDLMVEVVGEIPLYFQPSFFYTEQSLANLTLDLLQQSPVVDMAWVRSWIDRFTANHKISLSPEQQQAVEMAATERVMILTRGFKRGVEEPLPHEVIVVDEASMLDLFLANSLLKAVAKDAQLLLVGDIDQLLSVRPGNVLADLINSERIPVVRLTQVFRQAEASGIIRAAHQINRGQFPGLELISAAPKSDCLWHVIQLKNDYEREVFNGDLGMVGSIDSTEQEVTIIFDERKVVYDYGDLNELGLAWSISIHKSQGSEYPVVILPLYMQHYLLLSRNLIYTGLTRAKQFAIGLAVKKHEVGQRYTRLQEQLKLIQT